LLKYKFGITVVWYFCINLAQIKPDIRMLKKWVFIIVILFATLHAKAQVTDHRDDYLKEKDTVLGIAIELEEVIIDKNQIKISD
jgi:hypothetical protein